MFNKLLQLTLLVLSGGLLIAGPVQTLRVTTTSDADAGSLRAAIIQANGSGFSTLIQFDIPQSDPGFDPATGVWTIKPLTELPKITVPTIIDGYTQRGSCPNCAPITEPNNASITVVIEGPGSGLLNPAALVDPIDGIRGVSFGLDADGSIIKGLCIINFPVGVEILSSDSSVRGMFLGIAPDGVTAQLNGISVLIGKEADAAWIGSGKPEDRNLIAGTGYQRAKEVAPAAAVTILGPNTAVQNVTVGLTSEGTALPVEPTVPLVAGIVVDDTVNTAIGTSTPTPPPPPVEPAPIVPTVVVATFATNVVVQNAPQTSINTVAIGTDITLLEPATGSFNGSAISIIFSKPKPGVGCKAERKSRTADENASIVTIANCLASGHKKQGILISGVDTVTADFVRIQNTKVGTDFTGTKPLPNGGPGVIINRALDTGIDCCTINYNEGHGVHHLDSQRTTVSNTDASNNSGDGFNFLPVGYVQADADKAVTIKGDTTAQCVCDNDDSDGCLCARFTYGPGQICC